MIRISLGSAVRDRVTGFAGIATARITYLTGCDQYGVSPPAEKGTIPDTQYFDEGRVEVTGPGIAPQDVQAEKKGGPNRDAPRR